MKYILSLAVILAANLTFAKTAAQLDQTQDIKIQIENQAGIQLQNLVLKPQFSCWTTDPEGGGEAGTSINEITVPFSYDVSGLSTSVINATVKIEGSSRGEAPKKRSFFSSSRCGAGVLLVLQEKGKSDAEILARMGYVTSRSSNANFTASFVEELRGQYLLKMVKGGEMSCSSAGARCSYCLLALFKKTPEGLKELGRSYKAEPNSCAN